ncbi:MAG: hypothetical protein OIF50_17550 [Flavobacteriaceae bacterium]|nr:hypothetical protein [Flavobacteriaceae bacterium]
MRSILKAIPNLLHPLLTPLIATTLFFRISSKYTPEEFQLKVLFTIFILTIAIPLLSYLLFKNLHWMPGWKEAIIKRPRYALFGYLLILLFLTYKIISPFQFPELYYYFIALIISVFTAVVFRFFKFYVQLHMLAMGSVLQFILLLSVHFQTNINTLLIIGFILSGLLATACLYRPKVNFLQISFGFLLGSLPPYFFVEYWL